MTDLTDAQWSDYARGQGITVAPRVYEGAQTMTHDPAMVEKVARSYEQFWFELGYGACWADAFMALGQKPAFPLTDAIVERAWAIQPDCYDGDPDDLKPLDLPALLAAAEAKGAREIARVERRERQSTKYWMRAAESALAGDMRALRNRVDMHKAAPVDVVLSSLRALPMEAGE